jgi:hypothetical protein
MIALLRILILKQNRKSAFSWSITKQASKKNLQILYMIIGRQFVIGIRGGKTFQE